MFYSGRSLLKAITDVNEGKRVSDVEERHVYVHSKEGCQQNEWQQLADHLTAVAVQAGDFSSTFDAGSWGYLAGLWHDLGKYCLECQRYICRAGEAGMEGSAGKVNHTTAGALLAVERFGKIGRILAYLIAGHHAGLPDWQDAHALHASPASGADGDGASCNGVGLATSNYLNAQR